MQPGGEVLGFGVLDLVAADAADVGHEDHRAGGDVGHADGVLAGATDDVLSRKLFKLSSVLLGQLARRYPHFLAQLYSLRGTTAARRARTAEMNFFRISSKSAYGSCP